MNSKCQTENWGEIFCTPQKGIREDRTKQEPQIKHKEKLSSQIIKQVKQIPSEQFGSLILSALYQPGWPTSLQNPSIFSATDILRSVNMDTRNIKEW